MLQHPVDLEYVCCVMILEHEPMHSSCLNFMIFSFHCGSLHYICRYCRYCRRWCKTGIDIGGLKYQSVCLCGESTEIPCSKSTSTSRNRKREGFRTTQVKPRLPSHKMYASQIYSTDSQSLPIYIMGENGGLFVG